MNIGKSFGELGMWANGILNRVGVNTNTFFNTSSAASAAPYNPTSGWDAAMTNMVANLSTQQQDLQAEATKLIAAHTNYFNLDEDALGKELAGRMNKSPELVQVVFSQLSTDNKVEVGRAMIGAMTDDGLREAVFTEDGRKLLTDIKQWVDANSLTGEGRANAQADRAMQRRIDYAMTRTDDVTMITTQQVSSAKQAKAQTAGARYTAEDLKRLYGKDEYQPIDDWVNRIARGEGGFATAGDVKDGNKLSVGIFQWTQTTGRLGKLMQKYNDVAEREGKLNEFHEVFGGKERSEQLLKTLSNGKTASSLSPNSIQSVFTEAGKRDVFKKAQVELARDEARVYLRAVAPHLPYTAADGYVSGRMMAAALIVKNIGGSLTSATFVRSAMSRTTSTLYDELVRNNPTFNRQLQERLATVKQETAGLKPNQQQEALEDATKSFKREAVEANVPEARFLEKLTDVAPRVLYTTDWKYDKYHRGVENRIRDTVNSVPQREKLNPNEI